MEGITQIPTLTDGQELSIGKQFAIVDKFLRWGPLLEDYALEIYQVRAKSSRQDDSQFRVRTLRKVPFASKRLLHAAVQELNTLASDFMLRLKAFRQCGNHPNIVSLVDGAFGPSPSRPSGGGPTERYDIYYLFEDEEIGTLADFLGHLRKQNGTISEQDFLKALLPVCEAVAFLHTFRPPLIHRNIRLSNVVMTGDNTLKLSGFLGVAFELPPGDMNDEEKRAIIEDLACYTEPRYRAPEVLYPTSRIGITTKSDIWALGVLLFVATFGRSPFHLSDPMDIVNVKYSFPRLEYTYIMEIIGTLLQKSPKSRPDIFEVIATIKYMLEEFQTLDHFDHSTRDLQAVFGGKIPPFNVPRRSYMSHDFKKTRRTGIPKAPPANFLLLPSVDEDYLGISVADAGQNDSAENVSECDISESEEVEMAEARPLSPNPLRVGNAVGLDLGDVASPSEGPLPSVESSPDDNLRSNTLQPEDETPATPQHGASSLTQSEDSSALEDPGPKERGVLINLHEEPNGVQSTPPSPIHPSPPRRGLTNTPASEKVSTVGARTPPAHELYAVVEPPRSGAGNPPSPDDIQEPTPGTQSFLNESPFQGYPEGDGFNELEESSGCSTPGNRREMEDDQVNADSDHEDFHTPPESFDQPSQNSSFLPDDIGSFITYISEDPVWINGHSCDVFEGFHSTAGKVALKRPRIGGAGDDEEVIKRFEREAMAWRSLQHPHILKFLGTFKRSRHLYLVSPFINNGTLVEYIVVHPEVNRVRLLSETADALNYLHQNGVVHGDIKGTNILIDDNVHSLLCDFGLTKMTQSRTSTSMKGVGTFRWQSPELWLGSPKSFESDTYAFAMTIAEVLAGEAPFASLKNDPAVMFAVLGHDERPPKEPPESLSGVSYENTWEVAEACWSKIPEKRISMAVAFERLRADPSLS